MPFSPPSVLTFAASDPTGGAGIQADLLTLASLGCHPLSVITAISAQDTRGVDGLLAVEPEWVQRQARVLLADMPVAAFKIGVLGSARNAEAFDGAIAEIAAATNRLLETLGVEVEEGPDRWVPSGARRSGPPIARPMRDRREGVGV